MRNCIAFLRDPLTIVFLWPLVLWAIVLGCASAHAAIWGVKVNPDTLERRRWQTSAEYVQFEVPDHGLVEVRLSDGQLFIEAQDQIVVRGLVVNQVRLSFEK
jgi:hypothetical protein